MGNSEPSVTIPFLISLYKKGKLDVLHSMVQTYKPAQMEQAVSDAENSEYIKHIWRTKILTNFASFIT
jgi:Zn-dependent alcohol dehydrogenase